MCPHLTNLELSCCSRLALADESLSALSPLHRLSVAWSDIDPYELATVLSDQTGLTHLALNAYNLPDGAHRL